MEWLAERLHELGLPEKFRRERALQLREQQLEAEVASVDGRIPTWDRLNVLHLTADEIKLDQLKKELKQTRKDLQAVDSEIEAQLRGLRYESIELELASQIELCLRQARRDLWLSPPRVKPLKASLQALADRVLEQFAPDLDWEDVLRGLEDPAVVAHLAEEGKQAPREWPAGYAPILSQGLRPLMARELGSLLPNLSRQAVLLTTREKLEAEMAEVKADISLFDRVNVLTTTPSEAREKELAQALTGVHAELNQLSEQSQEMCYRALAAYPPLGIYLRALEAKALLARLGPNHEETLGQEGKVVLAPVLNYRHLVLTALKRLHQAYRRAFPALKLPRELVERPALPDGPLKKFLHRMENEQGVHLRNQALNHALMLATLEAATGKARGQISQLEELMVWRTSEPRARLALLESRRQFHEGQLKRVSGELTAAARDAASALLGFRLRDRAQTLVEGVSRMHTDHGTTNSPRACPVHNQEHCLHLYGQLHSVFKDYGLTGTYQEFLSRVAGATPLERVVEPDPVAGYPAMSATELSGMLAYRLQGSDFPALVNNLQELLRNEQMLAREYEQAVGEVTVWDTLNIFTISPAERRRDELARRRKLLSPDIARLQKEVESLLGRAAECYPPAALYFSLPQVDWAIRAVRAVCTSHTRKSSTSRRYRTTYRCALRGKAQADLVAQRWAAALIKTYGVLPTYHALLEAWALVDY